MNTKEIDYLLINLMEECAEVIQACSKAIRFDLHHVEPGYGHNGHKIAREMGQVLAVYDQLTTKGNPYLPLSQQIIGYGEKEKHISNWLVSPPAPPSPPVEPPAPRNSINDLPF